MKYLVGLGGTGKLRSKLLPARTEKHKYDIIFVKLDNSLGEALCEQLENVIAEKARSQTESDGDNE